MARPWTAREAFRSRGGGLEAVIGLITLIAMGTLLAICPACQSGHNSFLQPTLRDALVISGFAVLLLQTGTWLAVGMGTRRAVPLLVTLSLVTMSGGGALFLLAVQLGTPTCWLCLTFWLAQGFFAFRIASRDESWRKWAPWLVVSIALAGIAVKLSPSSKALFESMPGITIDRVPDWFGRSAQPLAPDLQQGEITVAAYCAACYRAPLAKFAERAKIAGEKKVFILSEDTQDLRPLLEGHDVRVLPLRVVESVLGKATNPFTIRIQNYQIMEVKSIL